MSATIRIENQIAVITMDDGKANAINPTMLASLNAALDQAEKEAKVVIITGRPERFSAGFDLKLMGASTPEDVTKLVKGGGALALRLFTFPMPVIAACTGHGIAMGCFILLSCDTLFSPEEAVTVGYLDKAVAPDKVMAEAMAEAERLKALPAKAVAGNKRILRKPTVDAIAPTVAM